MLDKLAVAFPPGLGPHLNRATTWFWRPVNFGGALGGCASSCLSAELPLLSLIPFKVSTNLKNFPNGPRRCVSLTLLFGLECTF